MKKLFICTFILSFMIAGFNACDSTTSPDSKLEKVPSVTHFLVTPTDILFSSDQGFTDTLINVSVEARFRNHEALIKPFVTLSKSGAAEIIDKVPLEYVDSRTDLYSAGFTLTTTTTSFEDYLVNMIYDEKRGNYAQTRIQIRGFSNARPELLYATNPDSVSRPETGTTPVTFTAKATDNDGQETIEGVYMRLISQVSGEVGSSPFELYDDGTSGEDEVAKDSIYTLTLEIDPTRQLQTYDIHYYAVDKGGLVSDTIKTTFSIVE